MSAVASPRLAGVLSMWTLLGLLVYVPLETYVTLKIAGLPMILILRHERARAS